MKERKAVQADIELKGTEKIEKVIDKKHSFRIYLQSKEKPLRTKDTERIA